MLYTITKPGGVGHMIVPGGGGTGVITPGSGAGPGGINAGGAGVL